MFQFIKRIGFFTTCKVIDEDKLKILNIRVNEKDLSFFNLSTNSIIFFEYNGEEYYFRECPQLCRRDVFFKNEIHRFFKYIHQNHNAVKNFAQKTPITVEFDTDVVLKFKEYINDLLSDTNFLKKLSNFDLLSYKVNFSIWDNQVYNQDFFEIFGFKNLPLECYDIAIYFSWYMRGKASLYRNIHIVSGKKYSYFSAVKSVSSKIVAECIGLGEMIISADFCRIELDTGETLFGVLSRAAKGTRMADCVTEPNGALQKELIRLNILDVICFQPDHGPDNYNLYTDINGKCCICAFDNDNPRSFFPVPSISHKLSGCSPLVDKKGNFNRPYLDKEVYHNIMSLNIKNVLDELKPYLNHLQLYFLCCRIKKLKKTIRQTYKKKRTFLIEDNFWNEKTVQEELSGRYGYTYLSNAVSK